GGTRKRVGEVGLREERTVSAPGDAGNEPKGRHLLQWKVGVCFESMRQPPHRRAGMEITYETYKVRAVWIEQIEQRRVVLTARSIAVPAYGFQRCHQSNIV